LAWFSGLPNFGDAEVVALKLNREGQSTLVVEVFAPPRKILVTCLLGDWVDVQIAGFGQQNVIGGLALKRAGKRGIAPWEIGVGATPGDHEIVLSPIFGANGVIRATLQRVTMREVSK
jgi:hypothetical protein